MNPEIKQKWVEALKSGKYEQGRETLCRLDFQGKPMYCCLGVLCDIYTKETGKGKWEEVSPGTNAGWIDDIEEGFEDYPSVEIREWAGLAQSNPQVILPNGGVSNLADVNDEEGWDFEQIAELIEKQL